VPHLSAADIRQFDLQLQLRRQSLLGALHNRLHQAAGSGQMTLAALEQAEADLPADTDCGRLQLTLADLQDTDDALARLSAGLYGTCTSCGGRIAMRRLRAQPAARMCLACQERFEQQRQAPS
jgi:DnaK suppressor protein